MGNHDVGDWAIVFVALACRVPDPSNPEVTIEDLGQLIIKIYKGAIVDIM